LFKCRYSYKGKQFEVLNWSVKIQHLGRRKTFSLQSAPRSGAAAEACELYRTLMQQGWEGALGQSDRKPLSANLQPAEPASPIVDKSDADSWRQRLIHREYTMRLEPAGNQELSVRIDHAGTGHYFPLGTGNPSRAATRALRIYQTIVRLGWETANKRFPRELTVALRWLEVPLAWTYTPIHTQDPVAEDGPVENCPGANDAIRVGIVESDAGLRRALEWCINHTDGFRCVATYASAAEALRASPAARLGLALVSHSLADKAGTVCLAELRAAAPEVSGVLYSVYEDSEEMFRSTPGGAGTCLLRRARPTELLEPIAAWLKAGGGG
jgi:hypothetical protein